ncbi:MAG TPA: hypothetical protein VKF36_22965 [Syntrophorhabdales bacterium]|nr:hypothetical protein [Syntrophorhabdales bacterium]
MEKPFNEGLRALYEQLLKLAEKEEQAITADNLGELEACMRRKEEIFIKLREIESRNEQHGQSKISQEMARLLAQVAERHERVQQKIKMMLGECQQAILEIQTGRRAHRAYYQARKKGPKHSPRLV